MQAQIVFVTLTREEQEKRDQALRQFVSSCRREAEEDRQDQLPENRQQMS